MARTKRLLSARDCMPFSFEGSIDLKQTDIEACLAKFVESVVPISTSDKRSNDDGKLAYSPFESQFKCWQAGRYIGECCINGIDIRIAPRFADGYIEEMLSDVYHFRFLQSSNKNETGTHKWSEIIRLLMRYVWIKKFSEADRYGLPRTTIARRHEGIKIRGRIDVRQSLIPLFAKQTIVSYYREKIVDDTICRIVYQAYNILSKRGLDPGMIPQSVQEALNDLHSEFHDSNIYVSENEYRSIQYKNIYQSWKPLVDFSWQIILRNTINQLQNFEAEGECLFLDMAEIWESFLRKHIGKKLAVYGWRTVPQVECEQHVYPFQFYGRKIIPDLVLEREKGGKTQYIVLDAKYKSMRGEKKDVDRGDFFQIHSYIQYYSQNNNSEVLLGGLLYPLFSNEIYPETDLSRWHSPSLFGLSEDYDNQSIEFIIDGIRFEPEIEPFKVRECLDREIDLLIQRFPERVLNSD